MKITPLPCPFCGSSKVSVEEGSTFRWVFAMCDECGAQAGEVRKKITDEGTPEEREADANYRAISEWNTRVPPGKSA
jgi:hypothetical protein